MGGGNGSRDRRKTTKKPMKVKKELTRRENPAKERMSCCSAGGGRVERGAKCQAFFLTFPFEGVCWVDWGGGVACAGCSEVCR